MVFFARATATFRRSCTFRSIQKSYLPLTELSSVCFGRSDHVCCAPHSPLRAQSGAETHPQAGQPAHSACTEEWAHAAALLLHRGRRRGPLLSSKAGILVVINPTNPKSIVPATCFYTSLTRGLVDHVLNNPRVFSQPQAPCQLFLIGPGVNDQV